MSIKPVSTRESIATFRNDKVAIINLYLYLGNSNDGSLSIMVEEAITGNYSWKEGHVPPVSHILFRPQDIF